MLRRPSGEIGGGGGDWAQTTQPLAIVMIVLVLGASFYLWREGYIRSRAAMIVIAAIVLGLGYAAFFTVPAYERF